MFNSHRPRILPQIAGCSRAADLVSSKPFSKLTRTPVDTGAPVLEHSDKYKRRWTCRVARQRTPKGCSRFISKWVHLPCYWLRISATLWETDGFKLPFERERVDVPCNFDQTPGVN